MIRDNVWLTVLPPQKAVSFLVARECFGLRVEDQLPSRAERNVRQVAQRGRQMPVFDLTVQIVAIARAHAIDEVLEVADLLFFQRGNRRPCWVLHLGEAEVRLAHRGARRRIGPISRRKLPSSRGPIVDRGNIALFGVEEHPHPGSSECWAVERGRVDFRERIVRVFEGSYLYIRHLRVRVLHELPPCADNGIRIDNPVDSPSVDR